MPKAWRVASKVLPFWGATVVGVQHPWAGAGTLGEHGPQHQGGRMRRRLPFMEFPADDLAAVEVEDQVEIEEQPPRRSRQVGVSSPRESHPQALAEPDVNLSAHPAPTVPAEG